MRSLIIPALLLAFTVYCLVDVVRSDADRIRGLPKVAWVVLVLLFSLPGGAAWLIAGRPTNTRPPGAGRFGVGSPSVSGPDDDPDFLRSLRSPGPVDPPRPVDERDEDAGPDRPRRTAAEDPGPDAGRPGGPSSSPDDQDDRSGEDDRHP